jgi:hypothetical protein
MANGNKPFGLRPHSTMNNSTYVGNVRQYYVASGGTAIFVGDPVKLGGSEGKVNNDDMPLPTAVIATINDVVIGVCVGFIPVPGSLEINYQNTANNMYILVDVDPQTVFAIQGNNATWDGDDVGLNGSITFTTGNTVTGTSNMVLNQSTVATTATLDVQILGSAPFVGNDLSGAYPLVLVKLNNHQFVDGATGV